MSPNTQFCPRISKKAPEVAFQGPSRAFWEAVISFETPALLFKVLTQKRWELLSMMTGAGPLPLREVARRVGRDVKAVHGDVHALLDVGILQKTEEGRIVFPFDAIRVNFVLQTA
jgi:predicted transcriptional regulator